MSRRNSADDELLLPSRVAASGSVRPGVTASRGIPSAAIEVDASVP